MNEAELRTAFLNQTPSLRAWGDLVCSSVISGLSSQIGERSIDDFLKIPPKPRIKNIKSFIAKAMYRQKPYSNPFNDITDKVGVRFVTLLVNEISVVSNVIEASHLWRYEVSRDFEKEKRLRPNQFDYQSRHYVVYANDNCKHMSVDIPIGLPCEIQVRTLLQHAFAELSHDTTYKTTLAVDPSVKREVAKTSALIETTDAIFASVAQTISEKDYELQCAQQTLHALYIELIGQSPTEDSVGVGVILDSFRTSIPELTELALKGFFEDKPFLIKTIQERVKSGHTWFAQSVILAVYYLAYNHSKDTSTKWPIDQGLLKPIYKDLGISLPNVSLAR